MPGAQGKNGRFGFRARDDDRLARGDVEPHEDSFERADEIYFFDESVRQRLVILRQVFRLAQENVFRAKDELDRLTVAPFNVFLDFQVNLKIFQPRITANFAKIYSGAVCVRPARLPETRIVEPNSPTERARSKARPRESRCAEKAASRTGTYASASPPSSPTLLRAIPS